MFSSLRRLASRDPFAGAKHLKVPVGPWARRQRQISALRWTLIVLLGVGGGIYIWYPLITGLQARKSAQRLNEIGERAAAEKPTN